MTTSSPATVGEERFVLLADQAQVGLVDQGGGLERLPGGLLGHLVCGEFA
jgi:hypothetical protein